MKRSIIWAIVAVIAVCAVAGYFVYRGQRPSSSSDTAAPTSTVSAGASAVADPANATYMIGGAQVTLSNGKASIPAAPGSASMVTTQLFGQPTMGDLSGGGTSSNTDNGTGGNDANDAAVILVQSSGGSGTFYYAAAAIASGTAAAPQTTGTNAILLGDRIAPQTVEIKNGVMIVNYADRAPGEPMTATPSVGTTAYFVTDGTALYQAPLSGVYPLYSGIIAGTSTDISWGAPMFATTTPSLIGVMLKAAPIANITDLGTPTTPFMNYYRRALIAAGWRVGNMLLAGGPGAEVVGYTKGNDYILIEYSSDFHVKPADAPEQCPCDLTMEIFAGEKISGSAR